MGAFDPARDDHLVVSLPENSVDVAAVEGGPYQGVEPCVDAHYQVAALLLHRVHPRQEDAGIPHYVASRLDADPLEAEARLLNLFADASTVPVDGKLLLPGP